MSRYGPVLAALLVLPWLTACAGTTSTVGADLAQQVSLGTGQSVSINGEDLEVRFAGIIGDSRCPKGATCVWAGEVSCRLEITYQGVTNEKVLVQPGLSGPASDNFASYRFSYDVQPYPEVGKDIKDGDYRLVLTVSRGAPAAGAPDIPAVERYDLEILP